MQHASAEQPVVVAEGLTKRFPGGTVALEDVSFELSPRKFVSVVGPSGCGKSTLLRLIAGLIAPTEGAVELHGRRVAGPRTDISMMFQKPVLLPWRTALENVLLPERIKASPSRVAWKHADELLRLVGLDGFQHHFPSQLSGGMQQRVALARLLMAGSDVLLMDEPFGALDEFTRERLNLELLRISRDVDATVVFVTHNIVEAVFLADQVLVMTPRPGKLAGVIDVDLGADRKMSVTRDPAFTSLVFQVRNILGAAE